MVNIPYVDGMGCHKDFVAVALLLLEVPVVQVVKFWGFQKRSRFLPTKRGYLWTSKTHGNLRAFTP